MNADSELKPTSGSQLIRPATAILTNPQPTRLLLDYSEHTPISDYNSPNFLRDDQRNLPARLFHRHFRLSQDSVL